MSPAAHHRVHAPMITPVTIFLGTLAAIGLFFIAQRFLFGLGPVTNLNSGYPWGIWVVVDIKIATALGSGGFVMAALIYVFNRFAYHSLMRPALLAGVLGYTLGSAAAGMDLGRYWNFYNIALPGYAQPNSVMFEVALCMLAYTVVLWIEFAPVLFERFGWDRLQRLLKPFLFVFIALGVLLPTMHQSSFGTVLLVMGSQLSPLWYSEFLPLYYLVTAIGMGFGAIMVEATVTSRRFRVPSDVHLLTRLGRIIGWLIGGFLAMRIGLLAASGDLALAAAGDTHAMMFLIENALFLIAFLVFASARGRASERLSFLGAAAVVLGAAVYRLNAVIIGTTPLGNWSYFPSVPELMVTIGLFALEILLFIVMVKMFPVLSGPGPAARGQNA